MPVGWIPEKMILGVGGSVSRLKGVDMGEGGVLVGWSFDGGDVVKRGFDDVNGGVGMTGESVSVERYRRRGLRWQRTCLPERNIIYDELLLVLILKVIDELFFKSRLVSQCYARD